MRPSEQPTGILVATNSHACSATTSLWKWPMLCCSVLLFLALWPAAASCMTVDEIGVLRSVSFPSSLLMASHVTLDVST